MSSGAPAPAGEGHEPRGPGFDPVRVARGLLRGEATGALGTLSRDGAPFSSLVTVATDLDGSPLILVSALSVHTANLDRDGRASLLLAARGDGDPLSHPRVSLGGIVVADAEPRIRRRFLARHPAASLYADFSDFTFRRFEVRDVHLNGGFARAAHLRAANILVEPEAILGFEEAEERAVAHMNADHADALRLYATRLAGAPDGAWRATGIDPDGIDLACDERRVRVEFRDRVTDRAALRATLVALAREAGDLSP